MSMLDERTNRIMPLKTYIKQKIKMLDQDFLIHMTEDEMSHIMALRSEIAVDNYVRTLFNKYWG